MSTPKKYPLSMNGDTFNAFKTDFDSSLRQLLQQMEEFESEEAVINMKMTVSLAEDQERDLEANGYDAMRDITKPTFKHEISTVLQIKNKKTGSLGGTMKLVWDGEAHQYILQDIDNGQQSFFDDEKTEEKKETEQGSDKPEIVVVGGQLPAPPAQLPPPADGGVIDADYTVVEDGEEQKGEEAPTEETKAPASAKETKDTPYGYLRQFVGQKLRVNEAAKNYTVRTTENKVVLSSAFKETDPFFCPAEKLKPHVGHPITCIEVNDHIHIGCEKCGASFFSIPPMKAADPDDLEYENPA